MRNILKETKIITIMNNKGGVAKTTSCTTLATSLGLLGYHCLVIDNDAQANSTATLETIPETEEVLQYSKTIVDVFDMEVPYTKEKVRECIVSTAYKNVDLIPSCPEHRGTNPELCTKAQTRPVHKRLAKAIRQIKDEYDYILIDTHPSLDLVEQNALCASDYVLIPMRPDGYSFQGSTPITNSILEFSLDEDMNPNLKLLGAFLVAGDPRTEVFHKYYDFFKSQFGTAFIPCSIRSDSSASAVTTWLTPLPYLLAGNDYKATGKWKAIYDYMDLMRETDLITDDQYIAEKGAFGLLNGIIAVRVSSENGKNIYNEFIPNKYTKDIKSEFLSKFEDAYSNHPKFSFEDIIRVMNNNAEIKKTVGEILGALHCEDHFVKGFLFPYDTDESNLKQDGKEQADVSVMLVNLKASTLLKNVFEEE